MKFTIKNACYANGADKAAKRKKRRVDHHAVNGIVDRHDRHASGQFTDNSSSSSSSSSDDDDDDNDEDDRENLRAEEASSRRDNKASSSKKKKKGKTLTVVRRVQTQQTSSLLQPLRQYQPHTIVTGMNADANMNSSSSNEYGQEKFHGNP
jgi:hypothetical protein